jgi:hypothetical protein
MGTDHRAAHMVEERGAPLAVENGRRRRPMEKPPPGAGAVGAEYGPDTNQ